ncbi:hypothetical protein [Rhodanobacter sp. L36]|uniref:hypothetical protein n=1 Tax=Rhodanobacter sp. L36 TaxID=1747221 RepID=UPI00131B6A47|nr:hypothetical protein [Rhodanobacter sp. L36]
MQKLLTSILVLTAIVGLVSCQKNVPANAASPVQAATSTSAASATVKQSTSMSVDPGSMVSCDPAAVATVKWSVGSDHPGISSVQLFVTSDAQGPKVLAEGGAAGQAQTGNWTRPGTLFVLKDKSTGNILDQVKVSGPACK